MLRRSHSPQIESSPAPAAQGFEHLAGESIAMLTWLKANKVEFVLVGPVAEAVRGGATTEGAVAIVPAPYSRNSERLARALSSVHAGLRPDGTPRGDAEPMSAKTAAELLTAGRRLTFACGGHDLEVEGRPEGAEGGLKYQELLYESARFELAAGLAVEVASPENIEHYAHIRRTGVSPEVRITRAATPELDRRSG